MLCTRLIDSLPAHRIFQRPSFHINFILFRAKAVAAGEAVAGANNAANNAEFFDRFESKFRTRRVKTATLVVLRRKEGFVYKKQP